jgi:hypothetical protein
MEKSFVELEYQIQTLTRRNAELEAALKRETARADSGEAAKQLAIAAAHSGVKPKAIIDAVRQALAAGQWKLRNGQLVRCGADGLPELSASREEVTPQMAIDALRDTDDDYLWPEGSGPNQQPSQPATAAPQGKPAPYTGENPWLKGKSWNFTKQVWLKESDPTLAAQLEKAAIEANQAASHGVRTGIPASRYRG